MLTRRRHADTFIGLLMVSLLLAIPDQRDWELGVELIALAVLLRGTVFWLSRRAAAGPSPQAISRVLSVLSPDTITTALLAVAGVLLLVGIDDGVYVVVPAVIAAIITGTASAWLFLTRIDP